MDLSWSHLLGTAKHNILDSVASDLESITVEMEKQNIPSEIEAEVGDEVVSVGDEVKAEPTSAGRKEKRARCWLFGCEGWAWWRV